MRSAGGERGPDLTTVAERLSHDRFRALLERHPTPTDGGVEPPGPEASEDLWAFLHAVAATRDGEPASPSEAAAAAP